MQAGGWKVQVPDSYQVSEYSAERAMAENEDGSVFEIAGGNCETSDPEQLLYDICSIDGKFTGTFLQIWTDMNIGGYAAIGGTYQSEESDVARCVIQMGNGNA